MSGEEESLRAQLGRPVPPGTWCVIGEIPQPPAAVHEAAGSGPLRPAGRGVVGVVLLVLLSPFLLLGLIFKGLYRVSQFRDRIVEGGRDRARHRETARRERTAEVFDGNWSGQAGQLLLRWYEASRDKERYLALDPGAGTAPGGILLAVHAQDEKDRKALRVLTVLPPEAAYLVDPVPGDTGSTIVRVAFRDGSWLHLDALTEASDYVKLLEGRRA